MKSLIVVIFLNICFSDTFAQKGLTFGFEFGKSVSLNDLLYSKEKLEFRTHLKRYLNSYDQREYTLRFPNIFNWGGVAEYRGKKKFFLRFKFSHGLNWLIFAEDNPSSLELLFPSSRQKKYSQKISYFSLSYHKQFNRKCSFFGLGLGPHISVYEQDINGKEEFNVENGKRTNTIILTDFDSTVSTTHVEIWMYDMPFKTLFGLNFTLEYSLQSRKAGRLSFYAQAIVNLTKSNLWFNVYHNSETFRRSNGFPLYNKPADANYYRFTNNPLQFGIIYYFPPLKLNRNIVRSPEK